MAEPREVNVDLIITQPTDDGFRLESSELPVADNKLTFANNGHDGFIVKFRIVDRTDNDYKFPRDEKKAMWVKKVSGKGVCPGEKCHWGQFEAKAVDDTDFKTLKVRNKNGHLQYFGFALRVGTDPDEEPTLTFDPIGDNQNGEVRA